MSSGFRSIENKPRKSQNECLLRASNVRSREIWPRGTVEVTEHSLTIRGDQEIAPPIQSTFPLFIHGLHEVAWNR